MTENWMLSGSTPVNRSRITFAAAPSTSGNTSRSCCNTGVCRGSMSSAELDVGGTGPWSMGCVLVPSSSSKCRCELAVGASLSTKATKW
eukprot:CAMPEP_0173058514 /NCGR_PEP_ID=MMETSP1102-20130122/1400_1 /TAXON_ID=49646 /ORGANISM="Geminigera sp., Strain Caron Lab Isolate" /LENGTH=88 /DNA_ID=CAMNT_0013924273 /DNA_START=366 /DNA_END=632 /DNA_ORIENTATION=-